MRLIVCFMLLGFSVASGAAQTPDSKSVAPLSPDGSDARLAAELQIDLLNKQLAALSELNAQYRRGMVTYPIALALPGPIKCQVDCRGTVEEICRTVKYPNSLAYPATVPADAVGVYVNGVCYGP